MSIHCRIMVNAISSLGSSVVVAFSSTIACVPEIDLYDRDPSPGRVSFRVATVASAAGVVSIQYVVFVLSFTDAGHHIMYEHVCGVRHCSCIYYYIYPLLLRLSVGLYMQLSYRISHSCSRSFSLRKNHNVDGLDADGEKLERCLYSSPWYASSFNIYFWESPFYRNSFCKRFDSIRVNNERISMCQHSHIHCNMKSKIHGRFFRKTFENRGNVILLLL